MQIASPSTSPRSPRGFTLIEILVVIGVIGLLSAILLPVLGRVRETGRRAACSSNMKQLGLAFQQYAQDANGRVPYAANLQHWADGGHWVAGTNDESMTSMIAGVDYNEGKTVNVEGGALFPYVKNAQVYMCPSTPDSRRKKLGYSMNCAVGGVKDTRVKSPSDIVLLVDEGQSLNDGFFAAVDKNTYPGGSRDELTSYHNGGGNLLFFDGHVKFYTNAEFPTEMDNAGGDDIKTRLAGTPRFRDAAFGAPVLGTPPYTPPFLDKLTGTYFTTYTTGGTTTRKSSCDYN